MLLEALRASKRCRNEAGEGMHLAAALRDELHPRGDRHDPLHSLLLHPRHHGLLGGAGFLTCEWVVAKLFWQFIVKISLVFRSHFSQKSDKLLLTFANISEFLLIRSN